MADGNEAPHNALSQATPTLPFAWYHEPDHYAQEMKSIWHRGWIYVCRSDALKPLEYQTLGIGTQNIVVLRSAKGALQAFHNACRHRGSILCTETQGRLRSRLIVCPYHQWSYDSEDGRLVKTTSFTEPTGFNRSVLGLFPVAVAEWRGCVLVNLDANAAFDPEIDFQRPPDNLTNFPLEEMVTGHIWQAEIGCNWKTFWENFNECLHCPNVHPELVELVPLYTRRIINPMDVPQWPEHSEDNNPRYRWGDEERSRNLVTGS